MLSHDDLARSRVRGLGMQIVLDRDGIALFRGLLASERLKDTRTSKRIRAVLKRGPMATLFDGQSPEDWLDDAERVLDFLDPEDDRR